MSAGFAVLLLNASLSDVLAFVGMPLLRRVAEWELICSDGS
jgi:hypothetical protein